MSSSKLTAALLVALSAAACHKGAPADFAPQVSRVDPAGGPSDVDTTITISGDHFYARGVQSLSAHGGVTVDDGYSATLDGVPLRNVVRVSETELHAVVPSGIPAGVHALIVESPLGQAGTLARGWVASDLPPAQLVVASKSPAQVSTGQSFTVDIEVRNTGGVAALKVSPGTLQLTGTGAATMSSVAPPPQDIPGGESRAFSFTMVASQAGTISVSATASGIDEVSLRPVDAPDGSGQLLVQARPVLDAVAQAPLQPIVSVGQTVSLSLVVTNSGSATAVGTSFPAPIVGPALELVSSPSPQDVPGAMGTATFTWTYQAAQVGFELPTIDGGAGADANDGSPIPVSVSGFGWPQIVVQAPAQLSVAPSAIPAQVSVGQTFTVTILATNNGEATALKVLPTIVPGTAQVATVGAAPPAANIGGGAQASFNWTMKATGAGSLGLAISAAGTDANSGAAVLSPPSVSPLVVQTPPQFTNATLTASPAQVSKGQAVQLTLVATNSGQATAINVTPATPLNPPIFHNAVVGQTARVAQPPLVQTVPGCTTAPCTTTTWVWTEAIDAAGGPVSFTTTGGGNDQNSNGFAALPQATSNSITVFNGASLSMTTSVSATRLSSGQDLVVTLNVRNSGDVTAQAVAPSLKPSGTATATATAAPQPADIPAGTTAAFQWTFHVTGTGSVAFAASALGTDQLSGLLLSAAANIGAIPVVLPAALNAAVQFPARLSTGQNAILSYTVTNTGQATAKGVTATATSGGVDQTPLPQDIAPNASFSFTFSYQPTAAGTLDVSVSASGTDANSNLPVSVGPSAASAAVQSRAAVAGVMRLSQAQASTGQTVQLVLDVTNSGQANAVQFQPDVPVPSAAGPQIAAASPAAADVPGGATVSFTWNITPQAAGSVTFTAGGSATDANSAATVPLAAVTSSALTVQTAAQLSSTPSLSATQVEVGQPFQLSLDVTNSGGASAAVSPGAPIPSVAGAALLTGSPSSQTVAGGSKITFTWAYTAQQRGPVSFSVPVTATDANSNATVSPPTAASPSIVLQAPPALAASISTAPSTVANTNQDITVSLVVSNSGDASLPGVTPVLNASGATYVSGPVPASATIGGNSSQTFSWTYRSATTGNATFSATAAGTDPVTNTSISASTPTPTSLTIQSPASLATDITGVPAVVNLGQSFQVTVSVANSGDSAASVTIPAPTVGGAVAASATPASFTSQSVLGHKTQTVVFRFAASATGSITLTANASGTDSTDHTAVTATPKTSASVTVQTAAQISATLSIPQGLPLGDTFSGSMTVLNNGDASANLTLPSALAAVAIDLGSATLVSGPASGTAVTVVGHSGTILSWSYTASHEGTLQFNAPITVIDATDLTTRTVSASSNTSTIAEAVSMGANPFGDSTAFASLASFAGQLWLGPSAGGGAAVTMNGDGSGARVVSWQLEHPSSANNGIYAATAAHTIGYKGCVAGTAQCGPDNESGRGLFFSSVVSGTEWLGLVGAHVNTGADYPRYLYLTNPTFPVAAGGYTDLAYSDLGGSAPTSATNATSAVAFHNQLYVGFQSSSGPVLEAVSAMPSLPGAGASAGDMGASIMPGVGGTSTAMIDSIAVFGPSTGDTLYLANANGFTQTSTASPSQCSSGLLGLGLLGSCGDWVDSTPSAAAYTAAGKASLTTTRTSDLEPADRAVPAMVTFGGRLFAARNTVAGPQLWGCTPSSGTQCSPGDWSLVAANSVGDLQLTQFNDPANAAITLLAATSKHLYVGFNNATRGVVVYRAGMPAPPANPAALSIFQFHGRLDGPAVDPICTGPGTACPGFGGDGLGVGATRIFDGKVFNLSGAENLYVAAGTGTTPVRVYRATR